ncbi:MAG: tubulin-tyrosine ligase family-domain-containing protein [Benjaminiella poitrasii]|nr:MAG: tubulin-tyrosine ligase family-domain-containing protein [Benjaminiella poitrasii]
MSSAFESFVTVHQYQLSSIPEELWQPLFIKLGEDYLDAGTFVELHHGDPMKGYSLHTKADKTLKKHSEIFLVDHAWTTSPDTAKEELRLNPSLIDRLENLMNIEPVNAPVDSDDEDDDEVKPADELIQLVASQANVSEKEAREALTAENNEVVNAIMRLTVDPEAKAEADRLEDQVMGQILASGKPQEKEDKENQEKLKRREEREKAWIDQRVEQIYQRMWSYLQTYTYSILQQDGQPISQTAWYITDEVGSALCHSSDPNVVCLPFIFSRGASGMIPYSVIFPIKDIGAGEILTCDLVPKSIQRESDRLAYLFAFEDRVLLDDELQSKRDELIKPFQAELEKLKKKDKDNTKTYKNVVIYTDVPSVQQFLKLSNVKFADDPAKANIIWTSHEVQNWDTLQPQQMINQLPNEQCITSKQNLAALIQNTFGFPAWYLPTYNIMTQLSEFVGDFLSREKDSKTNIWITKPWNMSHGFGLDITRNLAEIVRQYDNPMPKIAQHYLTSPCLYNGKKFDLRYFVLVRHTKPHLAACVYNMFLTRLANKKYDLENLDDHESHLTIKNHSNYQMTQLDCKSFIHNIEKQHNIKWDSVQKDIHAVIKNVLIAATNASEPLGVLPGKEGDSNKLSAFGIYGVDIMLTDNFKPIIIEVNFSPDCTEACQYDSEFVNNIFSVVDNRFGQTEKALNAFTAL